MTYLKFVPTIIAAIAFGGSFTASAEGTVAEKFAAMDTDASGLVSVAEFVTYATGSGKHTEEEAQAKFAEIAGDDRALSLVELEAAYAKKEAAETHSSEGAGS
jgi:Ca2+-binding EF-hand superfamily protein